jgi:hypothetical protein
MPHPAPGHDELTELSLPGDDGGISDAELTALALAADPDAPLGADVVPISRYLAGPAGLLPDWYMPPVMARADRGWRKPVVWAVVASFLVIEALGLCSVFGALTLG